MRSTDARCRSMCWSRSIGPCRERCAAFGDYLVALVVDFAVWESRPTGVDRPRQGALAGDDALAPARARRATARRIAFEIVREAERCDEALLGFALRKGSPSRAASAQRARPAGELTPSADAHRRQPADFASWTPRRRPTSGPGSMRQPGAPVRVSPWGLCEKPGRFCPTCSTVQSDGRETPRMFEKILIANRGEIACRVIKTARRMGIKTVAVYSDADRDALHVEMADEAVHIGPAAGGAVLSRHRQDHRGLQGRPAPQAVHPGYGFLSEREAFAAGAARPPASSSSAPIPAPSPRWATRSSRRRRPPPRTSRPCRAILGVIESPEHAVTIADEIGYPVMIKASAGGGGKGMRIAHSAGEVAEGFARAKSEAASSFGDDRVFVEKFIIDPAPHRDPGARRQARQRHLSRRARMLDPAPQPEGHRGGAVAAARRGDAPQDGRAGRRAGQGRRLRFRRHGRVRRRPGQVASTSSR